MYKNTDSLYRARVLYHNCLVSQNAVCEHDQPKNPRHERGLQLRISDEPVNRLIIQSLL